jgi:hypothetical protein
MALAVLIAIAAMGTTGTTGTGTTQHPPGDGGAPLPTPPDPPPGWLWSTAIHASAAYCQEAEWHDPTLAPGTATGAAAAAASGGETQLIETESTRAIVATTPGGAGAVVVAFRGSVTDVNWIRNFDFVPTQPWPSTAPSATVHAGFWATYSELRSTLRSATTKALARSNQCQLWITGHSLGGALASIMSVDIHMNPLPAIPGCPRPITTALVTFGSPRAGNRRFAELHSSLPVPTWRIAHTEDVIPMLPTTGWHGAQHVGHLHMFTSNFSRCIGVCSPLDQPCEDALAPNPVRATANTPTAHRMYMGMAMGRKACVSPRSHRDSWAQAVHSIAVVVRAVLLLLVVLVRVALHLTAPS